MFEKWKNDRANNKWNSKIEDTMTYVICRLLDSGFIINKTFEAKTGYGEIRVSNGTQDIWLVFIRSEFGINAGSNLIKFIEKKSSVSDRVIVLSGNVSSFFKNPIEDSGAVVIELGSPIEIASTIYAAMQIKYIDIADLKVEDVKYNHLHKLIDKLYGAKVMYDVDQTGDSDKPLRLLLDNTTTCVIVKDRIEVEEAIPKWEQIEREERIKRLTETQKG